MNWPWQRRRDSAAARAASEQRLAEVERMAPEVNRIADRLADQLAKNNFAEIFEAAFGRRA